MRPHRRVAPKLSPAPDHVPTGAAAGLTSARPLCTLRSSTPGHTPQKLPRTSALARRSTLYPRERGRQQARPCPFSAAPIAPLLPSHQRQLRDSS
ncbi:hypothetical protein NDU88_002767 [Pleurodeles waltl]|uniref:Uncharacterized protein n=1 Tax=Pleurodeles waltl TaxID=8319 RepID=A0AAV7T3G3_PLEWA|nr:hypothetical protein NDU88_002767 [Pleurodeles waltl]